MGRANPSKSAVLEPSYRSLRWGRCGRGRRAAQIHSPREMGSDRTPMGQFLGARGDLEFICALLIHSLTLRECWERDPEIFSNRDACFRTALGRKCSVACISSALITPGAVI